VRGFLEAAATRGRLCLLPLLVAGVAAAQLPAPVPRLPDERSVSGRVLRPDASGELRPVRGVWVVLHRVGSDTAAPLDSVRSRADGVFRFRYRASGDPDALYFVSAFHAGIAYFGPPLRGRDVAGEDAEVVVYDTTSSAIPLHVRGRHLIVGAPRPDRTRDIVEVFEIANDSSVTRLTSEGGAPTWSTVIPRGVSEFQVGQGDFAPETIRLEGERVVVTAPFAPGLKQLSFAYRLPQSSFPASYPLSGNTTVLEVLLEEPAATASAPGLEAVEPVNVEGRAFRRFLAQNVPSGGVVRVTAPLLATSGQRTRWIIFVAAGIALAMVAALLIALVRRRPTATVATRQAAAPDATETLARTIALLDDEFERIAEPDAARRQRYEEERAALKTRLAHALAAGEGRP
jgi:hypothetical protein